MRRRDLIFALSLLTSGTLPRPVPARMMYQDEIRGLAGEIVWRMEQRGAHRAKFILHSSVRNGDVNQLFLDEITNSFTNAGTSLMIIDENRSWQTLDRQLRGYADGRYNPGTLPRRGQTLAPDSEIDVMVQELLSDQYRVSVRAIDLQTGAALAADSRVIMPPQRLRGGGGPRYSVCGGAGYPPCPPR